MTTTLQERSSVSITERVEDIRYSLSRPTATAFYTPGITTYIAMASDRDICKTQTVMVYSTPYYALLSGPSGPNTPLVVLIHALMSSSRIFDSTVKALHVHGYRTLIFDLPGHGRTLPPASQKPGSVSFDTICHDLHEIVAMTTSSEIPFAIVGCSIGGVLALRYHMLYPPPPGQRTKILSMAAPGLSTLPEAPFKWAARLQKWRHDGHNRDLTTETLARWFPEPLPADFNMAKAREIVESCTLEGYELCVWATCHFDYTDELDSIKDGENVMILAGENDGNIGPRSVLEDASKRIQGSKYVLMKETGHIPPMHWPERFEKIMLDFLRGSSSAVIGG